MRMITTQARLCLVSFALTAGASQASLAQNSISASPHAAAGVTLVSMQVSGPNSMTAGQSTHLKATGTFSDGTVRDMTDAAGWSVLQTSMAAISGGVLTGRLPGVVQVQASIGAVSASLPSFIYPNSSSKIFQLQAGSSEAQIQGLINGSSPGDVFYFNAGTYHFNSILRLLPGRVYFGSVNGPAVLSGTGGFSLMSFAGSGLVVQNLVFDGGGLYLDGVVSNVDAEYNTFRNIDTGFVNWTSAWGVFMNYSVANSDFSYNTFSNLGKSQNSLYQDGAVAGGIFSYGLSSVTIEHNTFDTFQEGMHVFYDHLDGKNVRIAYNAFTNGHRIAIEQQGAQTGAMTDGLEIDHNTLRSPLNPWALTYGISLATVGSTNAQVHDNVLSADKPIGAGCGGSGCHYGYGIESTGVNTRVYNNVVEGNWPNGVAIGIGPSVGGAVNLSVVNNALCGPVMSKNNQYIVYEAGPQPGTVIQGNLLSPAPTCEASK